MKKRACAPSNIALVKYMGKSNAALNLPENPNFSATLLEFRSIATVETVNATVSTWEWVGHGLSVEEEKRALDHARFIEGQAREKWVELKLPAPSFSSRFLLSCENDFPARSGVASSASSFAAMTLAVLSALDSNGKFKEMYLKDKKLPLWAAGLSRMGSGSSCRSFFGPYVRWEGEEVAEIPSQLPPLVDLLLVVDDAPKGVPSSIAHQRIVSSPLYVGRKARAEARLDRVEEAARTGDLRTIALETWKETWEVHSLFHTSDPPFTYFRPLTLEILEELTPFVTSHRPAVVTIDAGANVHVLVAEKEREEWKKHLEQKFPALTIRESLVGGAAEILE